MPSDLGILQPCLSLALHPQVGSLSEPSPAMPDVPTRVEVQSLIRTGNSTRRKCDQQLVLAIEVFWFRDYGVVLQTRQDKHSRLSYQCTTAVSCLRGTSLAFRSYEHSGRGFPQRPALFA